MTSTPWTPGPWRFPMYSMTDEDIERARGLGMTPPRFIHNDGSVTVMSGQPHDDGARPIARVECVASFKRGTGHSAECPERDANASLIAEAPAMEELLRLWLDSYGADNFDAALHDTRALLARLGGG